MGFGVIIIGDEILSGKREDKHFAHVVAALRGHGLALAWCRIVGDVPTLITATLRDTFALPDAVFCFGGIGATPDDHTRQCAAAAAGVSLEPHPDAVAEIEARFGAEAYPHRIRMAELPRGARIIPNPYNRIPGFSFAEHHFLPGFPVMAWPMLNWVLEQRYAALFRDDADVERTVVVFDVHESQLLPVMEDLVRRFPEVRFSSLPSVQGPRPHIELSIRAAAPAAEPAYHWLLAQLRAAGVTLREQC